MTNPISSNLIRLSVVSIMLVLTLTVNDSYDQTIQNTRKDFFLYLDTGFIPISVTGKVVEDSMTNDAAGDPIPGVDISLEQVPGGIVARDTTDSLGRYSFSIIHAGTFRVRVKPPPGIAGVYPADSIYTFVAVSGVNQANLNFRLRFVPITVTGIVVEDSLTTDTAGDPIPGVDTSLEQVPGGIVARDTTDSSGRFSFTITHAGKYRVRVKPPPGITGIYPADSTYTIVAISGVNQTNLNFRLGIPAVPDENDCGAIMDDRGMYLTMMVDSIPKSPTAYVANYGTLNQINVPVTFVMSGPTNYTSTKYVNVNSGDSVLVSFDTTFNPLDTGTYNVKVYTGLVTDQNRSNDTVKGIYSSYIPIHLYVDSTQTSLSDTVVVPVRVSFPSGKSFNSAEVNFTGFQNHGLTYLGIDTAGTMIGNKGWMLAVNNSDTALITASAGAQSISGSGILYKLRFLVTGGSCSFIPVNISKALFNTGLIAVRRTNGGVFASPVPHYGDVDENGLIQAFDASKILQHLVQLDTLSCQGLANANVSNDTTVSALDAWLILRYVVGLINHLPYDTTILASGNIAMLGGSGSYGDTIAVPIFLSNSSDIVSFEGMINFDPSRLTLLRIDWSNLVTGFSIQSNTIEGKLLIAGSGTTQELNSGLFGTMYFANHQAFGQTQITFSRLRWNEGAVMENVAVASVLTGVESGEEGLPGSFSLGQSYPNPFNPSTSIKLAVPVGGIVALRIYNSLGQEVAVLVNEHLSAGRYEYTWNATGNPSGVYFYTMQAEGYTETKKFILLK